MSGLQQASSAIAWLSYSPIPAHYACLEQSAPEELARPLDAVAADDTLS